MTIDKSPAGGYKVDVSWSSSAFQLELWSMDAEVDETGTLQYKNGEHTTETYYDDNNKTVETVYEDGTGKIFVGADGKLVWLDDKGDVPDDCRFVKS